MKTGASMQRAIPCHLNNHVMVIRYPTPYPQVHATVRALLSGVQASLADRFIGLYLHGSLAYSGFNPETSDIDFLVVTDGPLPGFIFSALKVMHAGLSAEGTAWSGRLEGAYIPKQDLRRHAAENPPVPWLGVDGHFAWEKLGSDWIIQRWILREKGLVVCGPPLAGLIDPVSSADLRQAVLGSLREWWSPPFPSPERFENAEYQVYAILTMCRSLYVLEHGSVASKPQAAAWAVERLAEPWPSLVSAAAAWKPGAKFDNLAATLEFIRYTLAACQPGIDSVR